MRATLARFDVDLALLPINGRDAERYARNCISNMTYQEAADLAGDLKPRLTIPAHFDMFPGNTADPDAFQKYMAVKYPHLPVAIPQHGQRLLCSH
jgi:L-ascorbate metabolism protein UlaG (beta-lactamase superfamily)